MSVDTEDILQRLEQGVNKADVVELCEEVGRLRDLYNKLLAESKELSIGFLRQGDELKQVREQLRPRSIKDEPPPEGEIVWGYMPPEQYQKSFCARMEGPWYRIRGGPPEPYGWTHWLPMPPAPPQPDAFEEWARERCADGPILKCKRGGYVHTDAAKEIWDAAIQSTKSHGNAG